jgi:predicted DNA binding CopG/RHH family protein
MPMKKMRGRPPKEDANRKVRVNMMMHPQLLNFYKAKAKKFGIGYQVLIQRALELQQAQGIEF